MTTAEQQLIDTEIDGALVVHVFRDGSVLLNDGRTMFWKDTSYSNDSTGHNYVPDGDWVEYKANDY